MMASAGGGCMLASSPVGHSCHAVAVSQDGLKGSRIVVKRCGDGGPDAYSDQRSRNLDLKNESGDTSVFAANRLNRSGSIRNGKNRSSLNQIRPTGHELWSGHDLRATHDMRVIIYASVRMFTKDPDTYRGH